MSWRSQRGEPPDTWWGLSPSLGPCYRPCEGKQLRWTRGEPHLSGWPQIPPHRPAILPTSEKVTCLGEGRTTQYLPGIPSPASVTCVKHTRAIITLKREEAFSPAQEKAAPHPIPPSSGLSTAVRISHSGEGPPWDIGGESGEHSLLCPTTASGTHPKHLPKSSIAGPTPHIWSPATAVATLPHPGIAPNSVWHQSLPPHPSGKLGFQASLGRWKPTWENVRKTHAAQTLGGLGGRRHSHRLRPRPGQGRRGERSEDDGKVGLRGVQSSRQAPGGAQESFVFCRPVYPLLLLGHSQ